MISLMNYNVSRTETGKSQLAQIQSAYLKSLDGKNLTNEQLEQIESMLVTDARMMEQPEMYQGLDRVAAEFSLLKNSLLEQDISLEQSYSK